jgi:hypothetical protein
MTKFRVAIFLLMTLSFKAQAQSLICHDQISYYESRYKFVQSGNSGVLWFNHPASGTETNIRGSIDLALTYSNETFMFFDGKNMNEQRANLRVTLYPNLLSSSAELLLSIPSGDTTLSDSIELSCNVSAH